MKRLMKNFVKNIHWVLYAVFLLVQAFAHRFTVLFGDDYYYSNFISLGWDYFVEENAFHYTKTNGRFFVHLVDEILLGINFSIWRVFNLAVIALIVLFAAKIAAKTYKDGYRTRKFKIALLTSVFLFSAISPEVYINTIYWATGSVNYLFPVALVLIYFYYSKKDLEYDKRYKWLPVLAFFASFTVEQSSAAAFAVSVYIIVTCIYRYKRRPAKVYFVSLALSVLALCSVVFAPGNAVRTTYYPEFYSLGFFGKIFNGLYTFLYQLFGPHGLFLVFSIVSAFSVILTFRAAKRNIGKRKVLFGSLSAISALSLLSYIVLAPISDKTPIILLFAILSACVPLAVYFVYVLLEYLRGDDDECLLFFLLAAALQAVMLISPEFGYRTLLISLILMFIPALKAVILVSDMLVGKARHAAVFICALLAAASFSNPVIMGLGYMENYPVHEYNADLMERFASGEIETVKLAYPINDRYRYTMPYETWYHMMRYMQLYGLPKDMIVEYEKYPG